MHGATVKIILHSVYRFFLMKNVKKMVLNFLFTESEQIKLFRVQHIRKKKAFFCTNHRLENNPKKRVQDTTCSVSPEENWTCSVI